MKRAALLIALALAAVGADALNIPPEVTKVVAFVYVPSGDGGARQPAGTCFLVGVPSPANPIRSWVYAVTNQHVLIDERTRTWFPNIWLRLNTRAGGSEFVPIALQAFPFGKNLFPSHEPGVDLALIQIGPLDPSRFDLMLLPTAIITTAADQTKVSPGTDLFFSGMFSEYLGSTKMEPIVRFGRVAMLPQEKVNFYGVTEDLMLAEVFSFGGNSGSPVFYYEGMERENGNAIVFGAPTMKLAGVMQGFFLGNEHPIGSAAASGGAAVQTPQGAIPVFPPNSGIAAVIPAQKILDILDYPELKMRQQ
jgi:hypothetical protein